MSASSEINWEIEFLHYDGYVTSLITNLAKNSAPSLPDHRLVNVLRKKDCSGDRIWWNILYLNFDETHNKNMKCKKSII